MSLAGFSPSTFSLLYCKLKSVSSGVKNVALTTDASGIIFTLNDNSKLTVTLPYPLTKAQRDEIVKLLPTLSKMKEDTNGNLTYDGDRLLVESDKTTTDIDFDTEINF